MPYSRILVSGEQLEQIVSGLAGVLGYLMGIGGTHIGLKLFSGSPSLGAPINIEMVIGSVFLAIVVGLVASAYPAFMAARLNPNEALRSL